MFHSDDTHDQRLESKRFDITYCNHLNHTFKIEVKLTLYSLNISCRNASQSKLSVGLLVLSRTQNLSLAGVFNDPFEGFFCKNVLSHSNECLLCAFLQIANES